jgi:hypothetical protein
VTTQRPSDDASTIPVVTVRGSPASGSGQFSVPGTRGADYTDGRPPGEWESKYPAAARRCINQEACILGVFLLILTLASGALLGMSNQSAKISVTWLAGAASDAPVPALNIDFRQLAIFFVGSLGGTIFSIKWLVHSAAKCKWHLDRRYWRIFVPLIGGVYACVVLTLLDGGMIGGQSVGQTRPLALTAAFAFLVGYFSDGVSGLLSNIANAVFGTLEKK